MAQINLAETAAASVTTPATGKVAVYADDSTHLPSYKDSGGATHGLVGATGPTGPTGPSGLDPIAPHDYGSITGTATFDRADGPMGKGLVTGAVTITPAFTGVTAGDDALLILQTTQDGTGGWAITIVVDAWDGDGVQPVMPTTAGTVVSWYVELMPDGSVIGRKSGAQGIPGLTWLGAWSSATAYVVGDAVSSSGSSYIATAPSTNQAPPNASYWDVLAAQGASGTASVATDPIWDAKGDLAIGTGADTAARLAAGSNGQVPTYASGETTGVKPAYPPGHEFDYVQITTPVAISVNTEATAATVITGNSVTYDGATAIMISFNAPRVDSTPGTSLVVLLYEDATLLGRLAVGICPSTTVAFLWPIVGSLRRTPTAGAHTYTVKAYATPGSGAVTAGAGGSGIELPAFLRITQA